MTPLYSWPVPGRDVYKRQVHADAVDVGEFNPPETVLNQVAVNVRVLLVEVRHGRYEPAVVHLVGIVLGSIRVYVRGQSEGGLHEVVFVVGVVEPIFGGHVPVSYTHLFG